MTDSWWPASLAHIPGADPWVQDHVVVAEVRSFDEQPHAGRRTMSSALVPVDQIEAVKAALANLDHDVSSSGPHPYYTEGHPYVPRFWVGAKDLPSGRYEPLVLTWRSHDKTVLQPDPGFLMTYGLVPRSIEGGTVYWDDPEAPRHDIVAVTAPSVWNFPLGTDAYVSIAKDYLQDYLTLRQMALVQVFWEIRWAKIDAEMERRLGDEEGINIDFSDRRLQLGRAVGDRNSGFAQVWGARIVATPGALPITEDPLDEEGLVWPGISKPVTNQVAQALGVLDYVYVDDAVLSIYEGQPRFKIYPESGSVSHGTQWNVGYCDRVDRNLIRLEAKKLYEGAPAEVVRHWHKFAVVPIHDSALAAALNAANIATRAKDVTYALVDLGELLSRLAHSLGLAISPEQFVGLRRAALDYSGWWTPDVVEPISRHAPLSMSADTFLDRCLSLEKLLIEGFSESTLRKLLQAMGAPAADIKELHTLKLLDRIVCMAQLAETTGLAIAKDGAELWQRLSKERAPGQPVARLFALHDVRILQAHRASDRKRKMQEELKRFDIKPGEEGSGYGQILDRVYNALSAQLDNIAFEIGLAVDNNFSAAEGSNDDKSGSVE
jgi:hypothetical protein